MMVLDAMATACMFLLGRARRGSLESGHDVRARTSPSWAFLANAALEAHAAVIDQRPVIPAEAGIQTLQQLQILSLNSRFRGNDKR